MTILLTGTHLTPALATIQALRRKAPDARLVYVGRKHTGTAESVEKEEIERTGAEFKTLTFGKFHRHFTWRQIPELAKFPVGFWQAFLLMRRYQPEIVVSFGGYISIPLVLAGKISGAKIVIHEQTFGWGAANKLAKRLADVKAVSWKEMEEPGTVWTGNPIRQEVLRAADPRRHFFGTLGQESSLTSSSPPGQKKSGVFSGSSSMTSKMVPSGQLPVVYVTGGNQGAKAVDEIVEKILPDLTEKFEVFHQTKSKINFKHPRYHPAEWFSTPIHADILARAAVSVSRAGANTVAELMYLGIPSILIPLPDSAGGEQEKNAEIIAGTGLGKIIKQGDLSAERLLGEITDKSYKSYKDYKAELDRGRWWIKADADDKLAELILGEKE